MNLCISNIAWPQEQEDEFLVLLPGLGCSRLEVAPSKIWPEPAAASSTERRAYRTHVESFGLHIVSIQALLYSRPDLRLFQSARGDRAFADYLCDLCETAADLGAPVMVLGSPRNRARGALPLSVALERAAETLRPAAERAYALGTTLCIEPLGPGESDFITTADEGAELVRLVDHPGLKLHLDAKALSEESGDLDEVLRLAVPLTRHFHISEPGLDTPGSSGQVDHVRMGGLLRKLGYFGAVSIEMARQADPEPAVRLAFARAAQWYGNAPGGLAPLQAI